MTHRFRTIPKASSTARGYGAAHRAERERRRLQHNPSDPCCRCGHALGPWGPQLHLDHDPTRQRYRGMAHAHCNKRAGAKVGNRRQRMIRMPKRRITPLTF